MSQVVIDCFPEAAKRFGPEWAIVGIDVIRATTTAITAVELGRRCYPVPTIEAALPIAARLDQPLLVGELGGNMPYGFDITNSPATVAQRRDIWRSMILLSSSGTQLLHEIGQTTPTGYAACLRNMGALTEHLARRYEKVAVIGAGTRGEFREEDQYCCAQIAEGLAARGFELADETTEAAIERWTGRPADAWINSKSVDYLRRTHQDHDLDFVLEHVNDLTTVFRLNDGELVPLLPARAVELDPALVEL